MIEKVLSHYGADLSRIHGEGWRPLKCPFHDDRTASASVSLGKDAFRCHGCDMKGSAINLIMQREGVSYQDAIGIAETITGAPVANVRRSAARDPQASRWRTKLFPDSRD